MTVGMKIYDLSFTRTVVVTGMLVFLIVERNNFRFKH